MRGERIFKPLFRCDLLGNIMFKKTPIALAVLALSALCSAYANNSVDLSETGKFVVSNCI